MAEKRVSARLSAVGGRALKAELQGVGDTGGKAFCRLSREMEAANKRPAGFSRATERAGKIAAAMLAAAVGGMLRSSLEAIDAQAKLAKSLGTIPADGAFETGPKMSRWAATVAMSTSIELTRLRKWISPVRPGHLRSLAKGARGMMPEIDRADAAPGALCCSECGRVRSPSTSGS